MKKCNKCEKTYNDPELSFRKDYRKPDGLESSCKQCRYNAEKKVSRQRRDAIRYKKLKNRTLARLKARKEYSESYRCSVLNCNLSGIELHHVTYEDPLAVVPLCKAHHKMNHELCKLE